MRLLPFKAQPTNAFFANVSKCSATPPNFRLLSRVRGNQIVMHSSDNETVLGRSRKLGEAADHLIDGSEKRISRLIFEF